MPIVASQNQRVHYHIEGERGPYLILHPPLLLPVTCWYLSRYVDSLIENYRIILIEPLGQGKSDAPENPNYYTINSRIQHVLAVIKEIGIENFHFLGIGLGAQVGFMLAAQHPQRIRSLSTIEGHPYPMTTEMQEMEEGVQQLKSKEIGNYLQRWLSNKQLSLEQQEAIKRGNPKAYAIALSAMSHWPGIGEQLPSLTIPTLLFTATSETRFLSIREAGRSMQYGRYIILPKLKYNYGLLDAELIIEPLVDFIRKQRWPH